MTPTPEREDVVAALAEARAEIARLRKALKPFVKFDKMELNGMAQNEIVRATYGSDGYCAELLKKHFSAAAAALRDAREGR